MVDILFFTKIARVQFSQGFRDISPLGQYWLFECASVRFLLCAGIKHETEQKLIIKTASVTFHEANRLMYTDVESGTVVTQA